MLHSYVRINNLLNKEYMKKVMYPSNSGSTGIRTARTLQEQQFRHKIIVTYFLI